MLEKILNKLESLEKEIKSLKEENRNNDSVRAPFTQTPSFNPNTMPMIGPPQQDLITWVTNDSSVHIAGRGSQNLTTTIDNSDYLG